MKEAQYNKIGEAVQQHMVGYQSARIPIIQGHQLARPQALYLDKLEYMWDHQKELDFQEPMIDLTGH